MPISPNKLGLALDQLAPTDWERFEQLCNAFFASEFGQLYRSKASPSGDGGRDAELFSPVGRSNVVLQFSLRTDWRTKIRETVARLKEKRSKVSILIYATNQQVGALGDDLKAEYRGKPVIDIRDRSWFLSRANFDENRAQASSQLYDAVVAPLATLDGSRRGPRSLTSDEHRTLLLFLELQHDDEQTNKGLTKSCFEALVRAALNDTNARNSVTLEDIYGRIARLLPQYDVQAQLKQYIDAALNRLLKNTIKQNRTKGTYHLANEEKERLADKAAGIETLRAMFLADLEDHITSDPRVAAEDVDKVRDYVACVIELYLHGRGEAFASAVIKGANLLDDDSGLIDAIAKVPSRPRLGTGESIAQVCHSIVSGFLRTPSEQTLGYLKLLSDCYTLFAFLSAVPDVQRVTKKLFDKGDLWLDTSVILPIFAEWSSGDESFERPFTLLLRQIQASGLKCFISEGVLEEILAHLDRCVTFSRKSSWDGDVPFVAAQYMLQGHSRGEIASYIEEFRENHKPESDLREFLEEEFGIEVGSLESDDDVPTSVREEIVDYWQRVAEKRRRPRIDDLMILRMARHDAENYLNVVVRRSTSDQGTWLGYTSWWLTLDTYARRLLDDVSDEVREFVKYPPVISLDFLTRYLTFGPLRTRMDRAQTNPLELYAPNVAINVPMDLIESAQTLRAQLGPLSERRKRRRITASLDAQRIAYGSLHGSSLDRIPKIIAQKA